MKKMIVLVLFLLIILSAEVFAEVDDELLLYKDFYYGESGRSVYNKILQNSDFRPENLGNSYEEWFENESYDGFGPVKMKTMNEYYSMLTRTLIFNKSFNCRFRINKNDLNLTRVYIYGPEYKFEEETKEERDAFKKLFQKKYGDPTWADTEESEFEILNLGGTFSYNWKNIWVRENEKGKKEIKIGVLKRTDSEQNEIYSSALSIDYTKKAEKTEQEEIAEEDIDQILEDF